MTTQLYRVLVLYVMFLVRASLSGNILSIGIREGEQSVSGGRLTIICEVDDLSNTVYIYKTSSEATQGSTHISFCTLGDGCNNKYSRYNFTVEGTSVKITILELKRSEDERWWTCQTATTENTLSARKLYLTVYSPPAGVTLTSPPLCDLGTMSCSFTCTTASCTYPSPVFSWVYREVNQSDVHPLPDVGNKTSSNMTNGCSEWTGFISETLDIPQLTVFTDDTKVNVEVQCLLDFPNLPNNLQSETSGEILFAEVVSSVILFYGNEPLNSNESLAVLLGENMTLTCQPDAQTPPSNITWFIDFEEVQTSTSKELKISVEFDHHNKLVYCDAYNLQPQNESVSSNVVVLYVEVVVTYLLLEPENVTILDLIEEMPEPIVCITSSGRPNSTIQWYKYLDDASINISDTVTVDIIRLNDSLVETKSILKMKANRNDDGWNISCSAYNVERMTPIKADNPMILNVLYSPRNVTLSYNSTIIVDQIAVPRSSKMIIECDALANPPVEAYFWNINGQVGPNLTIEAVEEDTFVNCTVLNRMVTTSGLSQTGYNSADVLIKTYYYPDPPRKVNIFLSEERKLGVSWIPGHANGLPQSFFVQIRNASSTEWSVSEAFSEIAVADVDKEHSAVITIYHLPVFVRMYAENGFGKSTYTHELFIGGDNNELRSTSTERTLWASETEINSTETVEVTQVQQVQQADDIDAMFITNVSLSGLIAVVLLTFLGLGVAKVYRKKRIFPRRLEELSTSKNTEETRGHELERNGAVVNRRDSSLQAYAEIPSSLGPKVYKKRIDVPLEKIHETDDHRHERTGNEYEEPKRIGNEYEEPKRAENKYEEPKRTEIEYEEPKRVLSIQPYEEMLPPLPERGKKAK